MNTRHTSRGDAVILVQGHIPKYDPQGNLTSDQKLEMFDLSLEHLRSFNPEAYIVLTGHGVEQPTKSYLANWVFWEDAYPINDAGLVIGYPAQFRWLGIGLEHIKEKGFENCLKTRLDCIIGRAHIFDWCQKIVEEENKKFLITQMTGEPNFLGDCFVYGPTDALLFTWNKDNHFIHPDGLIQTAEYFKFYLGDTGLSWKDTLKRVASFRDVWEIPFCDLRWNWHHAQKQEFFKEDIYTNEEYLQKYIWGRTNGWHVFDDNGKMISTSRPEMWSKEQFYA